MELRCLKGSHQFVKIFKKTCSTTRPILIKFGIELADNLDYVAHMGLHFTAGKLFASENVISHYFYC